MNLRRVSVIELLNLTLNFSLFHPFDSSVYRIHPSFLILNFV